MPTSKKYHWRSDFKTLLLVAVVRIFITLVHDGRWMAGEFFILGVPTGFGTFRILCARSRRGRASTTLWRSWPVRGVCECCHLSRLPMSGSEPWCCGVVVLPGCLSGGGQVKAPPGQSQKMWMQDLEARYLQEVGQEDAPRWQSPQNRI